jgi:hypothetical protein
MKTVHIPDTDLNKGISACMFVGDVLKLIFTADGDFDCQHGGEDFIPPLGNFKVSNQAKCCFTAPLHIVTVSGEFEAADGSKTPFTIDVRVDNGESNCKDPVSAHKEH